MRHEARRCLVLNEANKRPTLGNWEYLVWTHSLIISSLHLPLAAAQLSLRFFTIIRMNTYDLTESLVLFRLSALPHVCLLVLVFEHAFSFKLRYQYFTCIWTEGIEWDAYHFNVINVKTILILYGWSLTLMLLFFLQFRLYKPSPQISHCEQYTWLFVIHLSSLNLDTQEVHM